MDQKRLKGGTWLYNTALNIFTTCGKSFMHRLLCRFEESCHQSRQCFIKGKKKERYSPACSADSTGDTTPSTQTQPVMLPAEPGRGKKIAFNEDNPGPHQHSHPHLFSLHAQQSRQKITQAVSPCTLCFGCGCCSPQLCSHSGFLFSHRFFCHLLRLRWINWISPPVHIYGVKEVYEKGINKTFT